MPTRAATEKVERITWYSLAGKLKQPLEVASGGTALHASWEISPVLNEKKDTPV